MFLNEKLENIYNTVDDPKERNMHLYIKVYLNQKMLKKII